MNHANSQTAGQITPGRGWRESLLLHRLARVHTGTLKLTLPGGEQTTFTGTRPGPMAELTLHSPRLVNRLIRAGSVGFAEAYMAGDCDSRDLGTLLHLLHVNTNALEPDFPRVQALHTVLSRLRHWLRHNSRRGSRRNIAYHYDLGNDFYAHWLDSTWTYSCALFAHPGEELETAQRRKYQRLLDRIAPEAGDHILEIGCGWGGFALYAARRIGCRVTGVTLSTEQLRLAREQARAAGLDHLVTFELRDYRDLAERYDHVVSIEMFEAVGEAYWPQYFQTIRDRLRPGGRAAIQMITIDESRFAGYRASVDFIQKYIFPGGMLASPRLFAELAARHGLQSAQQEFHGQDYARTLKRWDARVSAARSAIVARYDERFWRMWRYYLAYSWAGFTSGNIDLLQTTLVRD